jgi:serine/threonine protein phosphatase 1
VWTLGNGPSHAPTLCGSGGRTITPPAAMIALFRQLLSAKAARPAPAVPPGERVYAIGDIHGRRDLFDALVAAIDADDAASGPAKTTVILLGDLIDRGPDSAGVLAAARAWQQQRNVRILAGNHEEMFLQCFTDTELMRHFLRFGGRETVLSYPVDRAAFTAADTEEAQALMGAAVPESDLAFIRGFEDRIVIGDYLFVHAGIRPGVPLEQQEPRDLRWIRGVFTDSRDDHGLLVVHGHTIFETPDIQSNRIGIDTGAYYSGTLTALRLEGVERALLETHENAGRIDAQMRSIP